MSASGFDNPPRIILFLAGPDLTFPAQIASVPLLRPQRQHRANVGVV